MISASKKSSCSLPIDMQYSTVFLNLRVANLNLQMSLVQKVTKKLPNLPQIVGR